MEPCLCSTDNVAAVNALPRRNNHNDMKALSLWQRFAQWYKRLRHSKGFGVHSPYAFMLVGQLLNCPYRYYAYDDIEGYLLNQPDSRRLRHDARLLIRIVGRMGFSLLI